MHNTGRQLGNTIDGPGLFAFTMYNYSFLYGHVYVHNYPYQNSDVTMTLLIISR